MVVDSSWDDSSRISGMVWSFSYRSYGSYTTYRSRLELQSFGPRRVAEGLHAPVVLEPAAVEADLRDPGLLGAARQKLADGRGRLGVAALALDARAGLDGACGHER